MVRRMRKADVKPEYDLDIVIPVYGQAELLARCLASIEATKGDIKARVIVVDDCGPDREKLNDVYLSFNGHSILKCDDSILIYNHKNMGFSYTVNTGVNRGNAPLILILNSDIELQPDCLQQMVREFQNSKVGIVGPKLIFADNRWQNYGKVQHAGLAVNWFGQFVHVNLGWSPEHPKVNKRREMQAVTGACLMISRQAWRGIHANYRSFDDPTTGALNEIYSKGQYEDVELCFAARALDLAVVYQPKATALHYVGASVTGAGEGFPTARNENIFKARCGHLLVFDEWRFL